MLKLMQGDCLELMQDIPDKSVDLILTDPPYNIGKAKWDKIPNYIEWCGKWLKECERLLKDNGSFYFWHNDMVQIAQLMEWIRQNTSFEFRQLITWNKTSFKRFAWNNRNPEVCRDRNWFPNIEYCLFYTFQDGTGLEIIHALPTCFAGLKKYMDDELAESGYTEQTIGQLLGNQMASHYFGFSTRDKSQFALPTLSNYEKLQLTGRWQRPYEALRQEYEALRQEYEALRQEYEALRYTFNLNQAGDDISCIWESGANNSGAEHACKKPIDLLERIVNTSSNPGDTILDCFMGSGSTGVACINTNRSFIGIELDAGYFKIAEKRIADARNKPEQISLIANK